MVRIILPDPHPTLPTVPFTVRFLAPTLADPCHTLAPTDPLPQRTPQGPFARASSLWMAQERAARFHAHRPDAWLEILSPRGIVQTYPPAPLWDCPRVDEVEVMTLMHTLQAALARLLHSVPTSPSITATPAAVGAIHPPNPGPPVIISPDLRRRMRAASLWLSANASTRSEQTAAVLFIQAMHRVCQEPALSPTNPTHATNPQRPP
jgi:hypothetical protein